MAKQGGLFLRGNNTLLENVAGIEFLPDADLAEAFVTRKDVIIPVNLERLIKGGDLSQNIRLQPGDTVVVPAATNDVLMLGALNKPGRYKLKQRDTLLSALAMAEGLARNADLLQAYLAREGGILPINFKRLLESGDISQNQLAKDKDFVYVPDVNDNEILSWEGPYAPVWSVLKKRSRLSKPWLRLGMSQTVANAVASWWYGATSSSRKSSR